MHLMQCLTNDPTILGFLLNYDYCLKIYFGISHHKNAFSLRIHSALVLIASASESSVFEFPSFEFFRPTNELPAE